jgi:phosphatidylglycerophosphatase A
MEKRFNNKFMLFIAQGFYSGRSPFAPGTAGSVVAVPLYLILKDLSTFWYLFSCLLVAGIAIWTSDKAEKLLGKKDDGSIVIDEIAGYLVAMIMIPSGWGFIAAGFFLFRLFDVIKPFPLRRLQDLRGGLGIVIDDIGAGIYTNIVLHLVFYFIKR